MSAYVIKFFFSNYEVDFATFSNDEVDSAIFLEQKKQPLIATKALCVEWKKLYSSEVD